MAQLLLKNGKGKVIFPSNTLKMILAPAFAISLFLSAFSLEARPKSGSYADPDMDELRLEIDDLKQALHTTQVDLSLLEEKNHKQESSKQNKNTDTFASLSTQLSSLEKKTLFLEKTLEKISSDLRALNTAFNQTSNQIQQVETRISSQDERLSEVSKLKGTLSSIAKAVGDRPTPSAQTYKVKSGDSLEKIARHHHTTTESIRKINHLSSDKIIVGQELRISNDSP